MKYVFGPVPSRRLGRSLGVDLVPRKTCSYDCIYCQLGRTTDKIIERLNGISVTDVLDEVKERLATRPDHITLSGSGEPTLCSGLGDIIEGIRGLTDIPVAVLTNGSLFWLPEVRQRVRNASLVLPSLDAGDEEMFQTIDRPHPRLNFPQVLEGLIDLRREFTGQYWLEVMLLAGLTAVDAEARKIAKHVGRIRPDRVQINTATRPPSNYLAAEASPATLRRLAKLFPGKVEVIADRVPDGRDAPMTDGEAEILDLLHRRPCTMNDILDALQLKLPEATKYLGHLAAEGLIGRRRAGASIFFTKTESHHASALTVGETSEHRA